MENEINKTYGNRVRPRVVGICEQNEHLLLIKHRGLGPTGILWAPPGGGMDFGMSAIENLKREFLEECSVQIQVGKFLFTYEYVDRPLHAVELFFEVSIQAGEPTTGYDPETATQLIEKVVFVPFEEIRIMDKDQLHGIFSKIDPSELLGMDSHYHSNFK